MHRMRRKLEPQILTLNLIWTRAWEIASHLRIGNKNEEMVKRELDYFNTTRTDPLCLDNALLSHLSLAKMADNVFKCISMHGKFYVSIPILMKFIHSGSIDNIPALVQIMAWRRPGTICTNTDPSHRRMYAGGSWLYINEPTSYNLQLMTLPADACGM